MGWAEEKDDTADFLRRVLPWSGREESAYFNLHYKSKRISQHTKQNMLNGAPYQSVSKMAKAALYYSRSDQNLGDVWVCMSSQSAVKEVKTGSGKTFNAAVRSAENAVHLRSLFLDLDVKDKGYASAQEALTALKGFRKAYDLPKPNVIVQSGSGGFHVYWALTENLPRAEWQLLANALSRAAQTHGLKFDSQCTVNPAQLLRVPGTVNSKISPASPVVLMRKALDEPDYSPELFRAALSSFMTSAPIVSGRAASNVIPFGGKAPAAMTGAAHDENDDLAGGIETGARPIDLFAVAEGGCGFIATALDTGGEDYSQPLWNLTTLAATFAENGREMAHEMANGWPGYNPAETDALYDRKMQEKQEHNLGWPSCRAIELAGCSSCPTCPHRPKDKSPFNFQKPTLVTQSGVQLAEENDLPAGYVRNPQTKVVSRLVPTGDGGFVADPLLPYAMFDPTFSENPWMLAFYTLRPSTGKKELITVPADLLGEGQGLSRRLNAQGLAITGKARAGYMGEFFVAWLTKLQEIQKATNIAPLGWHTDDSGETAGFAYDGQLFTPAGNLRTGLLDPQLRKTYAPSGKPDAWLKAAEMTTQQGRPDLDTILASAFAAPLVRLTGEKGLVLSTYSPESGIGKTTTLKIAHAVWGNPHAGLQMLGDTHASVTGKMEQMRNLPVYWDEIKTEEQTQQMIGLVFQTSSGIGKARMNADTTLRHRGTWATMLIAASNRSLLDFVIQNTKETPAGLARVFEFAVLPRKVRSDMTTGDAARLVDRLEHHYGHAGKIYSEFLGKHSNQIEQQVVKLHNRLIKKYDTDGEERYWAATMACLLMGAKYANYLKLTTIDIPAMEKFLEDALKALRSERSEFTTGANSQEGMGSILSRYLGQKRARQTLVTDIIPTGPGRIPTRPKIINDPTHLYDIVVHIGQNDRIIRIDISDFREWVRTNKYPLNSLRDFMKAEYAMTQNVMRLGGGTDLVTGNRTVYNLYTRGTDLEELCKGAADNPTE